MVECLLLGVISYELIISNPAQTLHLTGQPDVFFYVLRELASWGLRVLHFVSLSVQLERLW